MRLTFTALALVLAATSAAAYPVDVRARSVAEPIQARDVAAPVVEARQEPPSGSMPQRRAHARDLRAREIPQVAPPQKRDIPATGPSNPQRRVHPRDLLARERPRAEQVRKREPRGSLKARMHARDFRDHE